jgi:alpha-aminoadipic semialdehyde synthase
MLSPRHPISHKESVLDVFCDLLQAKLIYEPNERDMVIMHHEFGIRWSGDRTVSIL